MSLFSSFLKVSGFTALSRVLGLVREMLISHFLGTSFITDAFVIAFKLPNFFRRFFAEGAFNAAFVPQFSGKLATKGPQPAYLFAQNIFSFMVWFLFCFVILAECFTPLVVYSFAPGFSATPTRFHLTTLLTRLTFPYIFFISLSAFFAGILNSLNKFSAAAATPALLNICMIITLFLCAFFTLPFEYGLSVGVLFSGLAQFIWLFIACKNSGYSFRLTFPKLSNDLKKTLKLILPGALGAGVTQVNILIDMVLASTLPVGSVSYLYFADRFNQLPLSILGISLSTVLLPKLSIYWRQGLKEKAHFTLEKTLSLSLQLSFPASVGLISLSFPIVALFFGHGSFEESSIKETAPALSAFALGLPAYITAKIFSAAFFSAEDTKTPVKIAALSVGANFILNLLLIYPLLHTGLALATSLSAWVNVLLLGFILHRKQLFIFKKSFFILLGKILICTLFMFLWIKGFHIIFPFYMASLTLEGLYVFLSLIVGLISYFLASKAAGLLPSFLR